MGNGITITINAATAQAAAELQKFFGGFTSQMDQVKAMSAGLNEILGAVGAGFGVAQLASFVSANLAAAKSVAGLNAALQSSGQYSAANVQALADQRAALEKTTGAREDQLVAAQAMLLNSGATMDMMPKLLGLTLDYAAATGTDATTAAHMLGMALGGQIVSMRGIRLEIDQSLPKYMQLQQMFDQLESRVGGQAVAMHSVAPQVDDFQQQAQKAKEAMGGLVLNDAVQPFLNNFDGGIVKLTADLNDFNQKFPMLSGDLQSLASFAGQIAPYIVAVGAALASVVAVSGTVKIALAALGPVITLVEGGFAAITGLELVPFFTAVSTGVVGLNTALGVLAVTLGSVAAVAAAVLVVLGDLWMAQEMHRVRVNEIQSQINVGGQLDQFNATIQKNIDVMVSAGQMTESFAKDTKFRLDEIRQQWAMGTISVDNYRKVLASVAEQIQKIHGTSFAKPTTSTGAAAPGLPGADADELAEFQAQMKQLSDALAFSEAQSTEKIQASQNELQEKQLKDSYEKRINDLQGYFAQRKALTQQGYDQEVSVINLRLGQLPDQEAALQNQLSVFQNPPAGVNLTKDDLDKEAKLQEELNKLLDQETQLKAALAVADDKRKGALMDIAKEERDNLLTLQQEKEAALDLAMTTAGDRVKSIQSNPMMTDAEKKPLLTEAYQKQAQAIQDALTAEQALESQQQRDGESYSASASKVEQLTAQLNDLRQTKDALAGSGSFAYQFSETFTELQNKWTTWAQEGAGAFKNSWDGATGGVIDGLTHLFEYGAQKGQWFREMWNGVVGSMISSFTKMAVNWGMNHIIMQGASMAFHAMETALGIQQTASSTTQTGIQVATHTSGEAAKTFATTTHAALRGAVRLGETIFHGVLVAIQTAAHIAGEIAKTAITAAQALIRGVVYVMEAAVAAMSAVAGIPFVGPILAIAAAAGMVAAGMGMLHGFEDGGRPTPGELALVGERGPELWVPDSAGTIIPAHKTAEMLTFGGHSAPSMGASNGPESNRETHIAVYHDQQKLVNDLAKSDAHEKFIVDVMAKNIHKFS